MPQLPPEIIHRIFSLAEKRTLHTLLFVSHQFRLIASPLLYASVHFVAGLIRTSERFLRTLVESPDNYLGRQVRRMTLSIFAFREDRYRDIYKPMLQRLSSLRHLHIVGSGIGSIASLHELGQFFSLTRFSCLVFGTPGVESASLAQFIESQPLIEYLGLSSWYDGPLRVGLGSLQKLHVLRVSLQTAPSMIVGRHITHLRIETRSHDDNSPFWSNLDCEALGSVVVFVVSSIHFDCLVKPVSRMPNLERLQLSPPLQLRQELLSSIITLDAPKLRHIRFDATWRLKGLGTPSSLYHDGVLKAFSAMNNLHCISFGVGQEWAPAPKGVAPERVPPAYDFFFRTIPSVRLRYRFGDSLESQWWEDWEAEYDVVQGALFTNR
ncbi:F-box domain-containing protein [Pleurotus pulmonarius]